MIRLYLDWNVYTNLRKEEKEPFKSILAILRNTKGKLLLPYSPSHLTDLKRGFSASEKSKEETYSDLNFLKEISEDHCLYFEHEENIVVPSIRNPVEYFNQLVEDKTLENFDFETLFDSFSNEEISNIWKSNLELMKLMPSGIDLEQTENTIKAFGKIEDLFPNLKTGNNFYNLMKDVARIFANPGEYSSLYKAARNSSVTQMKINTDSSQWGNPFDYLDKTLAKAKLKDTFSQFIDENIKNVKKDKPVTRHDFFINYYISLDTFGFYRDKEVPNLIDDAMHAYYGAHCEIFVTEDKNTFHKAKAVYEKFNISTIVCKPEDFQAIYENWNFEGVNNSQNIAQQITHVVQANIILAQTEDNELNPVTVYKIQYPIADFFNRLQISYYQNCTSLFLFKKKDNYSTFLFWSEGKSIVNKIVKDFGVDDNLRSEFDDELEPKEISDKVWPGRIWKRESVITEIGWSTEGVGIVLVVTIPR